MLLMLFCSILALISSRRLRIMFLVLFCFISVKIAEIQLVCDRRTDGPTDGRTDRRTDRRTDQRTDIPSYRDARTHLKKLTVQLVETSPCEMRTVKGKKWLNCLNLIYLHLGSKED